MGHHIHKFFAAGVVWQYSLSKRGSGQGFFLSVKKNKFKAQKTAYLPYRYINYIPRKVLFKSQGL